MRVDHAFQMGAYTVAEQIVFSQSDFKKVKGYSSMILVVSDVSKMLVFLSISSVITVVSPT